MLSLVPTPSPPVPVSMSEELEWELFDIFESGMFAFPIYDHKSARKIIRYLLMRGILDEEIADAIEDSTSDVHLWLNHSGKFQVRGVLYLLSYCSYHVYSCFFFLKSFLVQNFVIYTFIVILYMYGIHVCI